MFSNEIGSQLIAYKLIGPRGLTVFPWTVQAEKTLQLTNWAAPAGRV